MTFRVGQKVVCIDDSISSFGRPFIAVKGAVYTIVTLFQYGDQTGLLFAEILPGRSPGWLATERRFRPLIEKSTDTGMAILRDLLSAKQRENVLTEQ